jgi:hypothetical protein
MSRSVNCINNGDNPENLILGKAYRTLPDASPEAHGRIRVIDENKSEPDGYLYRCPCLSRLSCWKPRSGS